MRKSDCYFYEKCLNFAVTHRKKQLPCEACTHYEAESRIEKEWPGLIVLAASILLLDRQDASESTFSR
jgi:hypothetical protein